MRQAMDKEVFAVHCAEREWLSYHTKTLLIKNHGCCRSRTQIHVEVLTCSISALDLYRLRRYQAAKRRDVYKTFKAINLLSNTNTRCLVDVVNASVYGQLLRGAFTCAPMRCESTGIKVLKKRIVVRFEMQYT